jgi:hypothetical protein
MYKDLLVKNNSLTGVEKVFCAGSLLLKVLYTRKIDNISAHIKKYNNMLQQWTTVTAEIAPEILQTKQKPHLLFHGADCEHIFEPHI